MAALDTKQRMGVAALLLAASTLLSRLMGIVRDKVISWQFGAGQEADLYFAAFVVPDCINYLLAGGFMSITIMPLLAKLFGEDEHDAWAFFSCVLSWIALAALVLTLLCMLGADQLTDIVAPGFTVLKKERLAFYMRLILPAQLFFLCGACFTALLFLRRQFTVPALTPLIYNGAIILTGLLFPALATLCIPNASYQEMSERFGMTGYCLGVTLGAFVGAFCLPLLTARRGGLSVHIAFRHPHFRTFLLTALPLMLGQTIIMLDEQFLRIFGSLLAEGSVSLLNYARRIAQVPVGLVGQAAAVASYPFLVALLARGEKEAFYETINRALRTGLSLIIPCAGYLFANAWGVLTLIFHGGRFGEHETQLAVPLLEIMLTVIPFTVLYMILVRAFYAKQDTVTPAVTGTVVTVLALPVYYFIASRTSPAAIALTSAISVTGYVLWLFLIWIKRNGRAATQMLARRALSLLCITLPAVLCSKATVSGLRSLLSDTLAPILLALLSLAVSGIVFLLLFLPLAFFFVPEIHDLVLKLRARLLKKP